MMCLDATDWKAKGIMAKSDVPCFFRFNEL